MELENTLKLNKNQIIRKNNIINKIKEINQQNSKLPINSKKINNILGGGFYSKKKYILFGANKTGKTQICHQLCVQAYRSFLDTKIQSNKLKNIITYYLDAENTFRPERIKQISEGQKIDYKSVLKTINVSKIMSNSALLLQLKKIKTILDNEKIYLLIIDSLNNYYRVESGHKNTSLSIVKNTFLKILNEISTISNLFNIIVIATAQVFPNFAKNSIISEIPVGIRYINHFCSEFLYLSHIDDKHYAHLVNSEFFPEKKVIFRITNKGIEDYKL
jgi:DNA repair protein RadA